MHKSRRNFPPIPPIHPGGYDWQHPLVRLVAIPRANVHIKGAWDDLIAPVSTAAEKNAGKPINISKHHIIIPVHALQLPNIREKFQDASVLPEEYYVDALAQQSLRYDLLL